MFIVKKSFFCLSKSAKKEKLPCECTSIKQLTIWFGLKLLLPVCTQKAILYGYTTSKLRHSMLHTNDYNPGVPCAFSFT